MLQLYAEGNLDPSSDEIAERAGLSPRSLFRYFDDLDDLVRVAIGRQHERLLPLAGLDVSVDSPLAARVAMPTKWGRASAPRTPSSRPSR